MISLAGGGFTFLIGSIIWIAIFSEDPVPKKQPPDSQLAATPETPSSNPILSSAIARGEEIDAQTLTDENASLPDASNPVYYTTSLFLEKAIKGSADAQYQLGLLYLTGRGTLQDFSEASKWLILAAEQNHPLAQYELGLLYQVGQGVGLDVGKSYIWFNIAAAAGVEKAIIARDKAMRALSTSQLKAAQKEARDWLDNKLKSSQKTIKK
ncbi:MAG: tetratricopeptide repeat protein [Nitrosomonas sp.]|nr:tetratricopeptide repeat protein [Nitrosomonas sp.]